MSPALGASVSVSSLQAAEKLVSINHQVQAIAVPGLYLGDLAQSLLNMLLEKQEAVAWSFSREPATVRQIFRLFHTRASLARLCLTWHSSPAQQRFAFSFKHSYPFEGVSLTAI